MKKLLVAGLACLLITACATSPIPDGYSGPVATVRDTAMSETATRAQFFFLSEIDGNLIENGRSASKRANSGRGFNLSPQSFSRQVPAKQSTFTLKGEVEYGAPIQAMMNAGTLYKVEKKVTFTPQSNKTYVVKGVLTAQKQDVWLEDDTGQGVP